MQMKSLMASLGLCSLAAAAVAGDWPQWRGPNLDNVSPETDWTAEMGDTLWTAQVGLGYSSVVCEGQQLFTMGWSGQSEDGEDTVYCLDTESGDLVWEYSFPAKKWAKYHGGGTNCTPAIAGDKVYVSNREGKFLALNRKDGKLAFEKDLGPKAGEIPTWGYAASPLVVDDTVYVNFGKVFAFDLKGKERWVTGDLGHGYSTPTVATLDGKDCLISFNGNGINVIDRKSGKVLQNRAWKTKYDVNAATPIMISENKCFISSGYNHGCAMLEISAKAEPKVLWESKVMRNQMAGSVLFDGHLYGFDENMLKCIGLDGEEKWRERGLGKGAHTIAGGKIIALGDEGQLLIADASPEGFEPIGTWEVLDGGVCWTPPVLAGGLIFCRNSTGQLVCHDHATSRP